MVLSMTAKIDATQNLLFDVAVGNSRRSAALVNKKLSWKDFCARAVEPVRTAETFDYFCKTSKEERDEIKDVGWYIGGLFEGLTRKKANLELRSMLVLDADHLPEDWQNIIDDGWLKDFCFLYHTTHSHSPLRPRVRIVIPLSHGVTAEEYVALGRKVAQKVGINFFDDTTYEPTRIMYWASVSDDGEYVYRLNAGALLEPTLVLSEYKDWRDVIEWALSDRELLKAQKVLAKSGSAQEDPLLKSGLIGAFCRVYSIDEAIEQFLDGVYLPSNIDGRYSYSEGSTVNGVVVYENKWVYSHHESDPCSGRLVNAFDMVRLHLFAGMDAEAKDKTPVNKLPSFLEMMRLAESKDAVKREHLLEVIDGFDGGKDDGAWLSQLEQNKHGDILPKLSNLKLILNNDKTFAGKIAFNELIQAPVCLSELPWKSTVVGFNDYSKGVAWQSADDLRLRLFFEERYKVEVSDARASDAVNAVALEHSFHPIRDWLMGLVWDGVPRVETFLHRYLGTPRTPYNDAVSRKFLCAAVARVIHPGCKFDYVMVIESHQGQRKSSFIEALSMGWFSDSVESFKGREAVEGMLGHWIIELGELTAFSRAEIENIKSFVTRKVDRVRLAYDRRPGEYPRQTIFIGTTNRDDYLKDETGNRRFWPVKSSVESIDIESLECEIEQVWAEAVHLYMEKGELLYFEDPAIEEEALGEQKKRYDSDSWEETIKAWLEKPIPKDYWSSDATQILFGEESSESEFIERDRVCLQEIWEVCFNGKVSMLNKRDENRLLRCMTQIEGWEKGANAIRFGNRYGQRRGYLRVRK